MEKKINRGVIRTGETDIKVHLIDSFPNHPYHVFDHEDMTELATSIETNGLLIESGMMRGLILDQSGLKLLLDT